MVKAVVAGASGGIGQVSHRWKTQKPSLTRDKPLSLLLKASPLVDELSLYDVVNTPGVAADLSHISSPAVCSPCAVIIKLRSKTDRLSLAICPRMTVSRTHSLAQM